MEMNEMDNQTVYVCKKCFTPQMLENISPVEGCMNCGNKDVDWYVIRDLSSWKKITIQEDKEFKFNWIQRLLLRIVPERWISVSIVKKV